MFNHHRRSIRLPDHDYSTSGYYFLTICAIDRFSYFGEIENNRIILNDVGLIVKNEWEKSAIMRHEIKLDEYVIMPDHIHGIVIITKKTNSIVGANVPVGANMATNVGANGRSPLRAENVLSPIDVHLSMKPRSLSSFVSGFKSSCKKQIAIRYPELGFYWQRNYYEHIIRDGMDLDRIREYIKNNPKIAPWDEHGNDRRGERPFAPTRGKRFGNV